MPVQVFRLNIDLPKYPKGSIVYHKYEMLPSRFNNDFYAGNHKWYTKESGFEVQLWTWIAGMIDSCMSMQHFDKVAKKIVTLIKTDEIALDK